jgi:hypothetical protein
MCVAERLEVNVLGEDHSLQVCLNNHEMYPNRFVSLNRLVAGLHRRIDESNFWQPYDTKYCGLRHALHVGSPHDSRTANQRILHLQG